MSPKNSVAAERRMDLASLFCLIGRHGPAVAVAVVALVSVLAGFIIYRSVSGKRRKAAGARDDRDGPGPGDASVIRASLEGSRSSAESTDMSDEGSSEVKEDVDLIQSDLKIRHRRAAAAEKKPPPYSPSKSDIQVPANKHTTPDDTTEVTAVVWGSHKEAEAHAEDASQGLQSDTCAVAEDAAECRRGATDDTTEDVIEEFHDNDGHLKEPELSDDEEHEEEEEGVLKAECQEDEDPVCFEHTPDMGEKGDDDRLQDNKTTLETNGIEYNYEEPLIDTKDVPVPCISCGKNEEFEEENPDSVDCSSYSGNNCLSPEEEKKNEGEEAEEECVDYGQQAEIWSSTFKQETNLPFIQQDQWYIEDGGLAGEVIEEVIDEDNSNELKAVKFDAHSPQFNEQEVEIKQKEENGLLCNQEDGVPYGGADQVKEKMLTSDNTVASSDERNRSNVANSAALPCLSASVKVDYHDDRPPGVTTDAKTPISGIADFPDLSLDCQQPQKEDKIAPSLDEDTDSTILGPEMPSHETENRPENNENGTTMVLAEERNDQAYDPHVQSSYTDQKSIQMINYEAFDKASDATAPDIVACEGDTTADPDTIENITASLIVEEISCPHLPSVCQDQESNHRENNETFDETGVNSATDTPACDNAIPMMSVELSCPDMLSSSHDQHSDQTVEVTTGAAPEDIMPPVYQIHLPSFEQIELRINDMSFSSVGEESGISSMAVSPDLQDAGNEFDVAVENMVLPVMDCDLHSEGQTEAENSLFADDVAMSVINEDTAGTVFEPYPSRRSQPPHPDGTNSFAANEDVFGHEIENRYHRAMDQFIAQISASTTNFTDELKKQTNVKAVVEVVEIQKKEAGVSVEKKKETKAEEKEEDYEKTEISIMEATMDNNEWITDSNYQVLPWMNLSATSFAQDHTKTNQPPTEECQYSPAITDTTCIDTTDIPPPTEAKQTSSLSSGDENTESNKKIVAVQPMPQNVNVTFRVHYFTQSPYQTVAVTGNQQELGNWKGFIPLERAKDGQWATVVSLPAESHVEWKFVVVDKGEVCRWEECGNRLLDTGYGDDLLVHKWWGFL